MESFERKPDGLAARSVAWSSTKRNIRRQTSILEALGGQAVSFQNDGDLDDESEPLDEVAFSLVAPPGLRPEEIYVQMTQVKTGISACGRPDIELLMLRADMKRASRQESEIIDALKERLRGATSTNPPVDLPFTTVSRPEFDECMQQIDAARDSEGVPATALKAVTAFILRFSESILEHPFSPLLPIYMEAVTTALSLENMTSAALSRLSALVSGCYAELKAEMARLERNRAKRRRRQSRH